MSKSAISFVSLPKTETAKTDVGCDRDAKEGSRKISDSSILMIPITYGQPCETARFAMRNGSYSVVCWYGPFPIAPMIQVRAASWSPQA
jgi:hypothetical protein